MKKRDIVKYPTVLGGCIVIKMAVSMIPRSCYFVFSCFILLGKASSNADD